MIKSVLSVPSFFEDFVYEDKYRKDNLPTSEKSLRKAFNSFNFITLVIYAVRVATFIRGDMDLSTFLDNTRRHLVFFVLMVGCTYIKISSVKTLHLTLYTVQLLILLNGSHKTQSEDQVKTLLHLMSVL